MSALHAVELSPRQCRAIPPGEGPCPRTARRGSPYCGDHTGPLRQERPSSPPAFFAEWRRTAEGVLASRLRGEQPGKGDHDPELMRALLPVFLPLYYWYWRVEVHGVQNVPTEGAAILVANHSGTIPLDGAMLKIATLHEHGRNPWLLAADLAFRIPGFGAFLRRTGNARASRDETRDILRRGDLIGVFPEGFKGIGKGWKRRYQLQRFGRGGFVEMGMETGAPLIPVAIIGAEEAFPMIGNLKPLANRLGLPYFPITPTFPLFGPLGALPLPSKWIIAYGEPIPMITYGPGAVEDTQLVLEITEEVRQTVQRMLVEYLQKRRTTFL